ncbi:MAG: flagellar biosynthesis protein FliQ [Nitrospira sp.]|nr:flagellar biosynthesis protein FliQ [bacterium]MBL7048057.1 flagellar biosynthesis protein FliQ [Nitrospira sp.]
MTTDVIQGITAEVFKVIIQVAGPSLIVGLVIGLMVGFFQTVTQIQEFTLTFVPKMIGVFGCIFLLMPWMAGKLVSFTENLFRQIPFYIK